MVIKWKKEFARDVIALGSIPFYFIVFIRAVIGKFAPFVAHLVIAFIVLVILDRLFKGGNKHIGRGLVLVVFTSFFYQVWLFTFFAVLLWIGMIISLRYLKYKDKEIVRGVIFGIVAMIVSYYFTSLLGIS